MLCSTLVYSARRQIEAGKKNIEKDTVVEKGDLNLQTVKSANRVINVSGFLKGETPKEKRWQSKHKTKYLKVYF